MPIEVRKKDGQTRVSLSGACTVAHAAEVRGVLLESFDAGSTVVLDLGGVESADLSMLQLICSAHLEAQKRSVHFECGSMSETLEQLSSALGFHRRMPCSRDKSGSCSFSFAVKEEGEA